MDHSILLLILLSRFILLRDYISLKKMDFLSLDSSINELIIRGLIEEIRTFILPAVLQYIISSQSCASCHEHSFWCSFFFFFQFFQHLVQSDLSV